VSPTVDDHGELPRYFRGPCHRWWRSLYLASRLADRHAP